MGERSVQTLCGAVFAAPGTDRHRRIVDRVGLFALFAVGVWHWLWFLGLGEEPLLRWEWGLRRSLLEITRGALETGELPYLLDRPYLGTDRLLAHPELLASPQVLLLAWLSVDRFLVLNQILLYSVGFLGSLALRRRLGLSLFGFAIWFALFNFNGHVVAHFAVGHTTWGGYFLLPFVLAWTLDWVRSERFDRTLVVKLALALGAILLQGSFHIFAWVSLLFLLLCCAGRRFWPTALLSLLAGGCLAGFRTLPAGLAFHGRNFEFRGGFPSFEALLESLCVLRGPLWQPTGTYLQFHGWEYDTYVTLLGLLFLAWFGIWRALVKGDLPFRATPLWWPIAGLTLLSLDGLYAPIHALHLPLLNSQRVTTRFAILPVLLAVLLACASFQRWLDGGGLSRARGLTALAFGSLLAAAASLRWHSAGWAELLARPPEQVKAPYRAVAPDGALDSLYLLSLRAGLALSVATLVALVVWGARPSRTRPGRDQLVQQ